ncbi:MAG: hypothetical protein ACE14W_10835 [Candidatus Velamenicoccus archaeovorus]
MGRVIEFGAWKRDRRLVVRSDVPTEQPPSSGGGSPARGTPLERLDRAIARLDTLVQLGSGRIGPRVETELLAITGAVAAGRIEEAAVRAEILAERLVHPSSRAAR